MSELRGNLREEFQDKEYRDTYADESLSTYIATQIKVLREQRQLTQRELAESAGMAQPRIAVMEDINYSSWSISTLRRLAQAFDVRLSVKFENFSSLIPEIETLSREALERDSFADDTWFHKKDAQSAWVGGASDYGSHVSSPHQNEGALAMAVDKVVQFPQSPFTVDGR
jgi:transcriptional regulator with XRE-family HTH domain